MEFYEAVARRRSVRKFIPTPFPEALIRKAIEAAVKAPNSSNTQTWGFHWAKSPDVKAKLIKACLSQSAARTAAELVVFTANSKNWTRSQSRLIDWAKTSKAHKSVVSYYEKVLPMMYVSGPFSVLAPLKWLLATLVGFFRPMMRGPLSNTDSKIVAIKSCALAAENFVLAIAAEGGDTCMMEGFDEYRVKRLLDLPLSESVVMVIGIGYRDDKGVWGDQFRLPIDEVFKIH